MIEMFKIMKGKDKISANELFNRVDSDRTRGHSLRVKSVVRQGSFTQRVVNAWNSLPGKVVAAEKADRLKLEFVRYLEALGIKGYRGILAELHGHDTTMSFHDKPAAGALNKL